MSKLIFLLTLTIGLSTYAQNQNRKVSIMKAENPILIINDTIIGSIDLLDKISSDKVSEMNIFKERKLSSTFLFIENKKNESQQKKEKVTDSVDKTKKDVVKQINELKNELKEGKNKVKSEIKSQLEELLGMYKQSVPKEVDQSLGLLVSFFILPKTAISEFTFCLINFLKYFGSSCKSQSKINIRLPLAIFKAFLIVGC